jgi:Xaa-Pro aminopeptidase
MTDTEQDRRLAALRTTLTSAGLYGFYVPHADEQQLEYLPACAERLAWISGFTGSAGAAVVLVDAAAVFVDGRYTTQVREQVTSPAWEHQHLTEQPPEAWLAKHLPAGAAFGYDPRLHTPSGLKVLRAMVDRLGARLVAVDNLIDPLWTDRPAAPAGPAMSYPEAYAGESSAAKRARILASLRTEQCGAVVITAPDALAWLFNIRGTDVDMVPVALGYAILRVDDTATVYMPAAKAASVREWLAADVREPAELEAGLRALTGLRVRVDEASVNSWIVATLESAGATVDVGRDPCAVPRACKNATELAGSRAAHQRDGVSVARFLRWFSEQDVATLDEWSLARRIDTFRAEGERYRSPSFTTISGFGPNGAIVHYSVSESASRRLHEGSLYLFDSGVQYIDGTTDTTRTIAVGTPDAEMCRRYTQVLKGHVALTRARFPVGTVGLQLDMLARQFLWDDGVDYDHGTGHGVGAYLSVHEGPHSISKRPNTVPLRPGMVVSNEPGYYKPGAYGIRIENLLVVVELPLPPGGERPLLGFDPLTLIPYDRQLIDRALLTAEERTWIDAYHARVRQQVGPHLSGADAAWLEQATAPL